MAEDTEAALEWADYNAELCSGCSQPRTNTFDPNGPKYVAEALRCRGCAERDRLVKSWQRDDRADTGGIYFVVQERGGD